MRQIYSIIFNQGYIFGTKLICGAFEYVLKYSCLSLIFLESLKSPTETYDSYLLAAAGNATLGRRSCYPRPRVMLLAAASR